MGEDVDNNHIAIKKIQSCGSTYPDFLRKYFGAIVQTTSCQI